jgi:hypothetical protein
MLAHYSHVRLEAKRHALDALSSRHSLPEKSGKQVTPEKGHVTSHVTKLVGAPDGASEVVVSVIDSSATYNLWEPPESLEGTTENDGCGLNCGLEIQAHPLLGSASIPSP